MRIIRALGPALAVAVVASGCNGTTEVEGVTLADLEGTWEITQLTWTRTDGTAGSFDFIQTGGSLTVTINASGSVTGSGTSFITGDFTLTGSVSLQGDMLTVVLEATPSDPDAPELELPEDFSFTLAGNTLTLTNTNSMFDFDFDMTLESASVIVVLQRTG